MFDVPKSAARIPVHASYDISMAEDLEQSNISIDRALDSLAHEDIVDQKIRNLSPQAEDDIG